MNRRNKGILHWMRRVGRTAPILLVLVACELLEELEEPEEPTLLAAPFRDWTIRKLTNDEQFSEIGSTDIVQEAVEVFATELLGTTVPSLPVSELAARDTLAVSAIYSTEYGERYFVEAEAPAPDGLSAPSSVLGSEVLFSHIWRFRKDSPDAELRFVVSELFVEVYDGNGIGPSPDQCTWSWWAETSQFVHVCETLMHTSVTAWFWARPDTDDPQIPPSNLFFSTFGGAFIEGWGSTFRRDVSTASWAGRPLFTLTDFELTPPHAAVHQMMGLRSPVVVEIPLDSVAVGEAFEVGSDINATVWNRRQGESYVGAYFRDPVEIGRLSLEFEGATMLEPPSVVREPPRSASPAPVCSETGSGGAGGSIQFEADSYLWPEWPGKEARVTVTRTGGSDGEASVAFATGGGTATPGSDYEELTTRVRFADGEEGARVVHVSIIADTIEEPNETVSLTLSDPAGCATLGSVTSAELTIMDDDHPLPDDSYTIGGTVTGLEGSGLVLTNLSTDHLEVTDDGPFVFDRVYASGFVYEVRVDTQPTGPAQSCAVTNETGTVAGEDVTDIEVVCVTLPPGESLDPGFGDGGKVTSDGVGPATDAVLQDDGKVLVVAGDAASGAQLARFNPDGTPDVGFGTGGVVQVQFHGFTDDELRAVAVQPDGRIVVAGETRDGVNSPTQEDFVVARFNADGTLDTSFGGIGWVTTDFIGRGDGAHDVLVQPDGAIVVAGTATLEIDHPDIGTSTFAVVRYTDTGELDPGFGDGGRAWTEVAGATGEVSTSRISFGHAAALQPDGKIVLAGRVAPSGGSNPDIALVRYNPDGSLDGTFGGGIVREATDAWDEAADVVVQPDGRIVVAGHTSTSSGGLTTRTLVLARYNADGSGDGGFGSGGRAAQVGGLGRGLALQPDGKLVTVGWVGPSDFSVPSNFVVARFDAGGELDTTFGSDGAINVDFFGGADAAEAVVIQPDGRIVVAGSVRNGANTLLGLIRTLP